MYSIGKEQCKQVTAENLIRNRNVIISTQVLNEFCNVVFKKKLMTSDELLSSIQFYQKYLTIANLDSDLVINALNIKDRYHYSYWDSLIIATALKSGVNILYSEDMAHGQIIDGKLIIVNPFIE